jgi:biofilm PGA synthesis N-glycosyltransferase PgaC
LEKKITTTDLLTIERGAVVVLVPAHNEALQIEATIRSLLSQTRPPEDIVVIDDNCSDQTAELAEALGVIVTATAGNTFKKAGALNHAINLFLEQKLIPEYIITIDADTVLDRHFIQRTILLLEGNPKLGGVSAVCRAKPGLGSNLYQRTLAWLQSAEYTRAGATRMRYNIHTLSGAGSVLRAEAVMDVVRARGSLYDERRNNLVEDYEATLEIKRYGWDCTNNYHCVAYTDLMLSMRTLLRQRIRWVRGSVDELRRRGWKPETKMSILTLAYAMLGMPLFYFWMLLIARSFIADNIGWPTLAVMLMICTFQAITVKQLGWRSMVASFLLVPELVFNLVRHVWLIVSFVESYRSKKYEWE